MSNEFPLLDQAFRDIAEDADMSCSSWDSEAVLENMWRAVKAVFSHDMLTAGEAYLARLTPDEREEFAVGEQVPRTTLEEELTARILDTAFLADHVGGMND